MKLFKQLSYFLLVLSQLYSINLSYALQLISADNDNFLYTGRIGYSEPEKALLS